jgi:hypothetical protein
VLVTVVILFRGNGGETDTTSSAASGRTAVIVDQLSLTQPNPEFAQTATSLLEGAGYAVDYYSGREVTVDLFRELPQHGYDFVVLRAHSAVATLDDQQTDWVAIFTGELYDGTRYPEDQAANRVGRARAEGDDEEVFAITPDFVRGSMAGRFEGATVVLMGCDGLVSPVTAEAFLDAGAGAFVSWTKQVSPGHTDAATERLLDKLLAQGQPIDAAVAATAAEVGADPYFGAELRLLTN